MNDSGVEAAPVRFDLAADRRPNIFDLTPEKLTGVITEWGEPAYRARQILHWLYRELATEFDQMGNLPVALRRRLDETFRLGSSRQVAQQISIDGWTRKVLLQMRDGNTVETVLMLYHDRATVCVSSQVGCAMGCSFCATGQMGFTRNLTAGEIVEQVIWFNRWLRANPHKPSPGPRRRYDAGAPNRRHKSSPDAWFTTFEDNANGRAEPVTAVTNIVFMGMGEPLVNYHHLWQAIHMINSPQGLGIGARRMTVSTVGIVPQIRRFAHEELAINLAVSLHAADGELRGSFMPINLRYPLTDLVDACRYYTEQTRRRVTFEYVLISGTNDTLSDAEKLAVLLKGMLCHVNLIPLNPVPGTGMQATSREQVLAFQKVLEDAGIATTIRIERGSDIAAACGQLKVEEEQPHSRRRSLNPELVRAHVQADLASYAPSH
ncbi:MAG TPA: 23S rRNA (adenine(2503)-C(2))-methyltransferase RlmN [Chloroflexia bacterium]|nr:23S rRNA (adenine(2503)-C(2))-methyltransferase RlmN [Chloroflexia bacterium]